MRIAVSRSGGFAGLVRRAEADTADSAELAELLQRADLPSAGGERGRPQPDRFVYTIRVGDAAAVTVHESALDGPLRELVERVLEQPDTSSPGEQAPGRLPSDDHLG